MQLAQETIPANEAEIIRGLVEDNLKTVWKDGKTAKRGQHGKHHGWIEGVFRVLDPLPEGFDVGVFQPGREYACRVRFSNGSQKDDTKNDVRGMAIKLQGVEGEKLLPGQGHLQEQDFILVDHPTYFCSTMSQYVAFNQHFTPVQNLLGNGLSPIRLLLATYGMVMLLLFHRDILRAARAFAGRRVGSLLALTYHSTTPYLFGAGRAVKYKVIGRDSKTDSTKDTNGLRQTLWESLENQTMTLDFGVVVQSDTLAHPIEDSSVDWEAAGAEFVKLAELNLPRQENNSNKEFLAETVRFSPWLCLPEHRPLGAINRARRAIYHAMFEKRSRMNK